MLIGGVLTGLLVVGLFFTMLSSSPGREETAAQDLQKRRQRHVTAYNSLHAQASVCGEPAGLRQVGPAGA